GAVFHDLCVTAPMVVRRQGLGDHPLLWSSKAPLRPFGRSARLRRFLECFYARLSPRAASRQSAAAILREVSTRITETPRCGDFACLPRHRPRGVSFEPRALPRLLWRGWTRPARGLLRG